MKREDGINQVYNGLRHVVILGAGASIASNIRNPEVNGKLLPSMDNFISIVGLEEIVEKVPNHLKAKNFETLYGNIHRELPNSDLLLDIESTIQKYFGNMALPEVPTIYDYLVLSLRGKDLIATFNWDPFLYQAWVRSNKCTNDLPHLSFLHGNVSIGYSKEDKRCGPTGMYMRQNGGYLEPTKLLYPVEQKNYTVDDFISIEWDRTKFWLSKESKSVRVTVFGYGAPSSDVEAMKLLNDAWGTPDFRPNEQFEIIDVSEEDLLRERWKGFIHSSHYNVTNNYFKSSLAYNPRRTCESYQTVYFPLQPEEAFRKPNPVPQDFETLEELWQWHKELVIIEEQKDKNKNEP